MNIYKIPTKTLIDISNNQFRSKSNSVDYWDYKEEILLLIADRKERNQLAEEKQMIEQMNELEEIEEIDSNSPKLDKQVMIDSYRNISFYGERRGEQEFNYYTELLANDLEELGENTGNYRAKFIDKVMTIFHRQSSCASAFICGPANFNNRRNQKRWDSRDKALSDFDYWRTKYFKAVNRVRTLSPEAEIDVAIERLEYLETEKAKPLKYKHDLYKTEDEKENKDFFCSVYNVTTKIREVKKKIEVMKVRIERKNNFKPIMFKGGSIDLENDRVIIKHDEKPDREIIQAIKSNGFRWSPKMGNWCRKHTGNAIYDAKNLVSNVFGGEIIC